jgi:hypothetical protein
VSKATYEAALEAGGVLAELDQGVEDVAEARADELSL